MCGRFYIATEDTAEELQQIIDSLQRKNGPSIKTGEVFPTDIAAVIANNRALTPTPFAMKWGYSLQNSRPSSMPEVKLQIKNLCFVMEWNSADA